MAKEKKKEEVNRLKKVIEELNKRINILEGKIAVMEANKAFEPLKPFQPLQPYQPQPLQPGYGNGTGNWQYYYDTTTASPYPLSGTISISGATAELTNITTIGADTLICGDSTSVDMNCKIQYLTSY